MRSIIPMNHHHVAQVAELERLCFSQPWSERSVAEELDNPLSFWLVCVEEERVLGYVGSQTVLGETDMMNIAVSPESRRTGIGETLIAVLVEELKSRGSHCLSLEVRASNDAAIALYEKLGFLKQQEKSRWYQVL